VPQTVTSLDKNLGESTPTRPKSDCERGFFAERDEEADAKRWSDAEAPLTIVLNAVGIAGGVPAQLPLTQKPRQGLSKGEVSGSRQMRECDQTYSVTSLTPTGKKSQASKVITVKTFRPNINRSEQIRTIKEA